MPTPKQAHALVTYFGKKFKEKYGYEPKLNRYAARWGFDAILMDMSGDEAKGLIDHYFQTMSDKNHSLDWFLYNSEKLAEAKEKTDADKAALAVIRQRTKERTEEWRKKRGNN